MIEFMVDSVQGVLFPDGGSQQNDAQKLWNHIFEGIGLDGYQGPGQSPTLQSSANGRIAGLHCNIFAQPPRIDIVLSAVMHAQPNPILPPPRMPDLGFALEVLSQALEKLSGRVRPTRIAIVCELAKTVAPGTEGENLVASLEPLALPTDMTDFSMQLNRRCYFKEVPAFQMNRLCTWSSGMVGYATIQGPMQISPVPNMQNLMPYVGLKIDVNSAPETPIPEGKASVVIRELVDEAIEIQKAGLKRII